MRVKIGNYPGWIGPYQIAEKILFWKNKYDDDSVHAFGEFLAHGFNKKVDNNFLNDNRPKTWLYKLCEFIHSKKSRKVSIKIDPWDYWNADATISMIVLPILKELRSNKHGSGNVDIDDVPDHLKFISYEEYEPQQCFHFYHSDTENVLKVDVHARYEWLLDEIIWTFEQLQPDYDWKDQYQSGEIDFISVPDENRKNSFRLEHGENHTFVEDYDSIEKHQNRINNGLRLFGKYFNTLWD